MLPKILLLQRLIDSGVVAVIRRVSADKTEQVAQALVDGGVTALEVTVDSPGAFATIERLSTMLKNKAIVGAGTVIDSESARLAISAGAEFIFCPSLHQEVIRTALRYGKIAVPGVMTPTEMIQAIEWGADLVKLFPASGLGVQFIKDVKGPYPYISIIPTGGVNLENVGEFIKAGAAAVGIGGNLVNRDAVQQGNFGLIRDTAARFVEEIRKARSHF